MYEMHAVMTRALRLEFDDIEERMVEVDGPDGPRMGLKIR